MGITDTSEEDDLAGSGRDELLAFGWTAEADGGGLLSGRLLAVPEGEGWVVLEREGRVRLAALPTASAVRRFAQRLAGLADPAAEAGRLAVSVLEEELRLSREAVSALERAVADLEEQITELQVKDLLSARNP